MSLTVGARADPTGDLAVVADGDLAVLDVETDGSGDLDVGRQPDTELLRVAALPACRLVGEQLRVIGRGEHGVECLLVLAAVVVGATERRERERSRGEEVATSDLGRVDAELVGGDVDHALEHLRRLGTSGAAICGRRRRVRHDGDGMEADLREVVHALAHHLGEHRQERTDARIRAGLGDDVDVEPDERAVGVEFRSWCSSPSRDRGPSTPCSRCGSPST